MKSFPVEVEINSLVWFTFMAQSQLVSFPNLSPMLDIHLPLLLICPYVYGCTFHYDLVS